MKHHKKLFSLAVGGGSVIDCCKVAAAQAVLEEDIWDMELVQHRLPTVTPIPMGRWSPSPAPGRR